MLVRQHALFCAGYATKAHISSSYPAWTEQIWETPKVSAYCPVLGLKSITCKETLTLFLYLRYSQTNSRWSRKVTWSTNLRFQHWSMHLLHHLSLRRYSRWSRCQEIRILDRPCCYLEFRSCHFGHRFHPQQRIILVSSITSRNDSSTSYTDC